MACVCDVGWAGMVFVYGFIFLCLPKAGNRGVLKFGPQISVQG